MACDLVEDCTWRAAAGDDLPCGVEVRPFEVTFAGAAFGGVLLPAGGNGDVDLYFADEIRDACSGLLLVTTVAVVVCCAVVVTRVEVMCVEFRGAEFVSAAK